MLRRGWEAPAPDPPDPTGETPPTAESAGDHGRESIDGFVAQPLCQPPQAFNFGHYHRHGAPIAEQAGILDLDYATPARRAFEPGQRVQPDWGSSADMPRIHDPRKHVGSLGSRLLGRRVFAAVTALRARLEGIALGRNGSRAR